VFDISSIPAKKLTNIELPEIGTIVSSVGKHDRNEFFFSFSSFTDPGSSYSVDMDTFEMKKIHETKLADSNLDFSDFVTD
jgi:prolyl oligopeptidase PreP (S9A serine peptidase family)